MRFIYRNNLSTKSRKKKDHEIFQLHLFRHVIIHNIDRKTFFASRHTAIPLKNTSEFVTYNFIAENFELLIETENVTK